MALPFILQPLGLEAREFLPCVGRPFVFPGEQDDEAPGVLDPVMHRLDETRAERDVVVLDENFVARGCQNVGDLLRDGRDRAAPAEEKIEPFGDCARHWPRIPEACASVWEGLDGARKGDRR
jgi:hypothetical protein